MGEVDLGHATATEHRAQLVPAAEATRLFHSSSPSVFLTAPSLRPSVCCPAYRTRRAVPLRGATGTRYTTGIEGVGDPLRRVSRVTSPS
ncbi:hypothetical protein BLA24_18090 [Streptomyces cinnamoneus]|uniref:Uncharacterized protein n=1 Tax=Streptomyces cinnamoneus TaxID=53446 RepID=A0A2G1XI17_STRCJ|nr:hypothetical protein BLA24_18090 [Streptomyces cinnamoneus]PPT16577.1 hypothetical protein CYQ11_15185 [Streptomyces cinnamoneus]